MSHLPATPSYSYATPTSQQSLPVTTCMPPGVTRAVFGATPTPGLTSGVSATIIPGVTPLTSGVHATMIPGVTPLTSGVTPLTSGLAPLPNTQYYAGPHLAPPPGIPPPGMVIPLRLHSASNYGATAVSASGQLSMPMVPPTSAPYGPPYGVSPLVPAQVPVTPSKVAAPGSGTQLLPPASVDSTVATPLTSTPQQVCTCQHCILCQWKATFICTQQTNQAVSPSPLTLMPLPPPPPEATSKDLPPQWKSAQDGNGKVYYYHAITRKTQWSRPQRHDDGDITMELTTPEHSSGDENEVCHVTGMWLHATGM